MIRWLYRYVFRGFGIVLAIGLLTILVLAISSQRERSGATPDSGTTPGLPVKAARP
jgi:hypothetical protein